MCQQRLGSVGWVKIISNLRLIKRICKCGCLWQIIFSTLCQKRLGSLHMKLRSNNLRLQSNPSKPSPSIWRFMVRIWFSIASRCAGKWEKGALVSVFASYHIATKVSFRERHRLITPVSPVCIYHRTGLPFLL